MTPQREPDILMNERSVPLFTGEIFGALYIFGFTWSLIAGAIMHFTGFTLDWTTWLLLTVLMGFLIHLVVYWLKKRRFEKPVADKAMLDLVHQVCTDIGKGHEIRIWLREVDRQVFASTVNLLFKAILLSESTIADFLDKPEKGRVVLAKEILEMEKKNPLSRVMLGVMGFVVFSVVAGAIFLDSIMMSLFSLGPLLILGMIMAILAVFVAIPILTTRKKTNLDDEVKAIYGVPPDAARLEVFTGISMSQEFIDEIEREGDESGVRTKAIKRAAIVAVVSYGISLLSVALILGLDSLFDVLMAVLMPVVVAAGAFVITFITIPMWPIIKPGREPRDTKYDFQDTSTNAVQEFLSQEEGYEHVIVRGVKLPFDHQQGIVVFEVDYEGNEKNLGTLMPQIWKDINDPMIVGPLLLSEMKRDRIEKQMSRTSYGILGIGLALLGFGFVYPIVRYGFAGFFQVALPVLVIYILVTMIPLLAGSSWQRRKQTASDVEVAIKYPSFITTLNILIEKHHTLPYGKTSYRTRLERIEKRIGSYKAGMESGIRLE